MKNETRKFILEKVNSLWEAMEDYNAFLEETRIIKKGAFINWFIHKLKNTTTGDFTTEENIKKYY